MFGHAENNQSFIVFRELVAMDCFYIDVLQQSPSAAANINLNVPAKDEARPV